MAKLKDLRAQIDETDKELVELFLRRAELVLQVKETKEREDIEIYSPEREREILSRIAKLAANGAFPLASLERIFRETISATRSLIGEMFVDYVGPEHSAAHQAAKKQFGDRVQYFPLSSVEAVFARVERGDANYGVVPIEMGSGVVSDTFQIFTRSKLKIIAEIELQQRLKLIGSGGSLTELKHVFADAGILSRATDWLAANLSNVELIAVESSVAAAKRAQDAGPGAAAVIPESFSNIGQLKTIGSGIENDSAPSRFVVLGEKTPEPSGRDKTSLLCSVNDRSGALCDLLKPFADRGLTLTKIESKNLDGRGGEYFFFIEVVGHIAKEPLAQAIKELAERSAFHKVLGSYPAASLD